MAARTSTSAMSFTRTTNLFTVTNFTTCGWGRIVATTATPKQNVFSSTVSNLTAWNWETGGGAAEIGSYNGATTSFTNLASRPATGTDFFWWIRCAGTGAGQFEGGWASATATSFVKASATLQSGSLTGIYVGNNSFSEFVNGRHSAHKEWDAVLTDAELLLEMLQYWPMRTANLRAFHPMLDLTAANLGKDCSVNGYNMTVNGAITVEAGVPIRRDSRWAYAA